ncbi:MAG: cobalt-precorrin 5A hydrolase [Bacillota bacterium]
MKLAVIALTENGADISTRLKNDLLANDCNYKIDLFFPGKLNYKKGNIFNHGLKDLIKNVFYEYDGLIMVMALGIVVRVISPYLEDKRLDPAVVTMDEKGENVISTLSGHLGGANELTHIISEILEANPVITTATDTQGKMAFDVMAKKLNMKIIPFKKVKQANSALVNKKQINLYTSLEFKDLPLISEENVRLLPLSQFLDNDSKNIKSDFSVIISNKKLDLNKNQLQLIPRNLVIGIGCRQGVNTKTIENAVNYALDLVEKNRESIKKLATIDLKQEETGILEFAKKLKIPVDFVSKQEIKDCDYNYSKSSFVKEKIGVGGVCEPTAMISSQNGKLILKKTVRNQVTVAIVEEENYI